MGVSVSITGYSAGTYNCRFIVSNATGSVVLKEIGIRSTLPGAAYIDYSEINKTLYNGGSGTVETLTIDTGIGGLSFLANGEAFDLFFKVSNGGVVYTCQTRYTAPLDCSPEASFVIPERPTQTAQSVFYNGAYVGSVGTCLTNAIIACTEIQELRQNKQHTKYSLAWFYGAITASSDLDVACSKIVSSGVPPYEVIDCSSYGVYGYPDMLLDKDAVALYQKTGPLSQYALPQKKKRYKHISTNSMSYNEVCQAIKSASTGTDNSTAVFMVLFANASIDSVGINDSTPVGPLLETNRGGHAMAVLGWKTLNGRKYWICQNSWVDQYGRVYGDDGLYYIPWSWASLNDGITGFVVLEDDPSAPALPDISSPVSPPYTSHRGPDYLAVRFTPYSDANRYEIDWYEPVTGFHTVTSTTPGAGQMSSWNLPDGWTPTVTDMGINMWGRDGLWGRTFQVKFRYRNTANVWSAWSDTRGVTSAPYWPDACTLSGNGPTGVKISVPIAYAKQFGFSNPGRFSYIRIYYSRSPNVNIGSSLHEGYFDIAYPNTTGAFTGLVNGETYYFTAVTYLNVNGTLLDSYYRSDTATFTVGAVSPWSWEESNGKATDTQTKAAYSAIMNEGPGEGFPYLVWNDLVDKISEAVVAAGFSWSSYYTTLDGAKHNGADQVLTATQYNAARQNVGSHFSTGIAEVNSDTEFTWSYIYNLAQKLNEWIESI